MESAISGLLSNYEKGSLSRRELVRGLALLAASGTAATAQEDIDFKKTGPKPALEEVADRNIIVTLDWYPKIQSARSKGIREAVDRASLVGGT